MGTLISIGVRVTYGAGQMTQQLLTDNVHRLGIVVSARATLFAQRHSTNHALVHLLFLLVF
jgi:hypothetical protein